MDITRIALLSVLLMMLPAMSHAQERPAHKDACLYCVVCVGVCTVCKRDCRNVMGPSPNLFRRGVGSSEHSPRPQSPNVARTSLPGSTHII